MKMVMGALRRQGRLLDELVMGASFFAGILELSLLALEHGLGVSVGVTVHVPMFNLGLLVEMLLGLDLAILQRLDGGLVMILVSFALEHLLLTLFVLLSYGLMLNFRSRSAIHRGRVLAALAAGAAWTSILILVRMSVQNLAEGG